MDNTTTFEVWKDIVGFEGRYEVSNLGRVRSLERIVTYGDRFHTIDGKIKKQTLKKRKIKGSYTYADDGYLIVSLYKNNKGNLRYVHRLVAESFIPNTENKDTVNHIDGNKKNNILENLEWATHKENINHAIETGLSTLEHLGTLKNEQSVTVKKYDLKMNFIAEYPSMRAAERINDMANGSVSKAIKKGWQSNGYYWKL